MLPAVVAALQQPRLLDKALEPSNTTSSLPLMTLLLSAPVGPYLCDVPGDMEATFSHVGEALLGPTIWTLCRTLPFILTPLAPRAQAARASFRDSVDVLSPSIRRGRLPSRSDVNKKGNRTGGSRKNEGSSKQENQTKN